LALKTCVTDDGDYVFSQSEIDYVVQGILQIDQRTLLLAANMGAQDQYSSALNEFDDNIIDADLQTTTVALHESLSNF